MKKFIFSFFLSLLVLIFIWFIIGYAEYGTLIFDKHLDFKRIFNNFTSSFSFSYDDFLNALKRLIDVFNFSRYGKMDFFTAIGEIFNGLIIAPLEVIFHFVWVFISVIISFFDFIFYPKFI